MLYWAENAEALASGAWWWFVPPGLCLALLGTGLALMNFGVDEIANPRLSADSPGGRVHTRRAQACFGSRCRRTTAGHQRTDGLAR